MQDAIKVKSCSFVFIMCFGLDLNLVNHSKCLSPTINFWSLSLFLGLVHLYTSCFQVKKKKKMLRLEGYHLAERMKILVFCWTTTSITMGLELVDGNIGLVDWRTQTNGCSFA